jgi:hypothetical protein
MNAIVQFRALNPALELDCRRAPRCILAAVHNMFRS